jgi:deoxyguanosine kinase
MVSLPLPLSTPRWRHVAIEGAVGAGKTTLAQLLADAWDAELLLERPQDNPFLARFYAEGSGYALQTQLFFLFQRVAQYRALTEPGMFAPRIVSDFMFAKDELFARLTLSDDEYALYRQIQAHAAPAVPPPDLVIWLRASLPVLMERIARRDRVMERGIDPGYVQRLSSAYDEHFARNAHCPVLAIDTDRFDPVSRPADLQRLLLAIERFKGPRETLDPPPTIAARGDHDGSMTDR